MSNTKMRQFVARERQIDAYANALFKRYEPAGLSLTVCTRIARLELDSSYRKLRRQLRAACDKHLAAKVSAAA